MGRLQIINNMWVAFNILLKNAGTKRWCCDSCLFEGTGDWVATRRRTRCPDVPPRSFKSPLQKAGPPMAAASPGHLQESQPQVSARWLDATCPWPRGHPAAAVFSSPACRPQKPVLFFVGAWPFPNAMAVCATTAARGASDPSLILITTASHRSLRS